MNITFLSPQFPENYYLFCKALKTLAVNVLGIGDTEWNALSEPQKAALTEYYKVSSMENYEEVFRAVAFFIHKYGRMAAVESLNEYWLDTEARLRLDFNINGLKPAEMPVIKQKWQMKQLFRKAGLNVPQGRQISSLQQARDFVEQWKFPVVVKPNVGVGAQQTYRIETHNALQRIAPFIETGDVVIESFIEGELYSFDGLTNGNGNLVFYTAHRYSTGILDVVKNNSDFYYYSLRRIPPEIEDAGRKMAGAYSLKRHFFHFEMFRTPENRIVALEANMRPPGGLTPDMFNYAGNIDIYWLWANVVVNNYCQANNSRPYHSLYISRKSHLNYQYSHQQILERYGTQLMYHRPVELLFQRILGEYAYIFRSEKEENILELIRFIHAKHTDS